MQIGITDCRRKRDYRAESKDGCENANESEREQLEYDRAVIRLHQDKEIVGSRSESPDQRQGEGSDDCIDGRHGDLLLSR